MQHPRLDEGFVQRLMNGNPHSNPTLQIIELEQIRSFTSQGLHQLVISDGRNFMRALLASSLNHMVESNQIKQFTVITDVG